VNAKDFLSCFKLIDSKLPLRRFGVNEDGGYLLADRLGDIRRVYSYGIGGETSFDKAVLEALPECRVFGFDPTIDPPAWMTSPRWTFHKVGLACGQGRHLDHRSMCDDKDEPHILKIDVEGAEVAWLVEEGERPGSTCQQVVMELHGLGVPDQWPRISSAMVALAHGFALVHAHVNNYTCPTFTKHGELFVPGTVELTFIRWSMLPVSAERNKRALPLPGLDFSNDPQATDPPLLGWPWQVGETPN
jgi:hypothetical protein